MNRAIISIGSNINPQENVPKILTVLKERFDVLSESRFVQTKPIGKLDQDDFLNGSVCLETELGIEELKTELKHLEKVLGRVPTAEKYGPRTADLDVIIFNGVIIDTDFYEREFVKNSCLELMPHLKY